MSKQSEKPSGNHAGPDALLKRARELHNLGADWEKAWGRATLEGRIRAWPSGWGDDLQILIYGDFDPPKGQMHIESLGITIHPEKLENTIIHSVLCVLKATVTIEDKSVDALLDASRRINVLLGVWTLVTWGNSACGWWSYVTHAGTGGVGTVLDDENLSAAVEGILQLPRPIRKKVDAAALCSVGLSESKRGTVNQTATVPPVVLSWLPNADDCGNFFERFTFWPKSPKRRAKHSVAKECQEPYRHPLTLAYEFQELLEAGVVNNRAGVARHCGLSRARITQVMSLLQLPDEIQECVMALPPKEQRLYSGRRLQAVVDLRNEQVQLRAFEELRDQVS